MKKSRIDILYSEKSFDECWEWAGATRGKGYGVVRFEGKYWSAHRLSYTKYIGAIPEGMLVCHRCDNPKCVNPQHLFLGTAKDNTQDMLSKGRHNLPPRLEVCLNGHPRDTAGVLPSRNCRKCKNAHDRLYRLRKKTSG